ncbi:hypothetical protein, partial [Shewanella algae]|uniref:hypothetical protein n=1 Tax=Shewanella algae TaxID=38313 RepID=UPI0031F4BF77
QGQNQPRRDDFGLKIGKLSHRTSIKDGLGRHIGSCGPLNRSFLKKDFLPFSAKQDLFTPN